MLSPLGISQRVIQLTYMIDLFLAFLKILHNDSQSGCPSSEPHQQQMRAPVSPYPHQDLLSVALLIVAILTEVKMKSQNPFHLHSLIVKEGVHFLTHFSAPFISSFKNSLFRFRSPSFEWVTCFLDS